MAGTMAFFTGDLYPGHGNYYNTSATSIPSPMEQEAFVSPDEQPQVNAHVDKDTHRNIFIVLGVVLGLIVLPNIKRIV